MIRTSLHVLLSLSMLLIAGGCGRNPSSLNDNAGVLENLNLKINLLNEAEKKFCDSISFDKNLVELLKMQTGDSLEFLPAIDEEGDVLDSTTPGFCLKADLLRDKDFILANKERFRSKGYLIFFFENNNDMLDYLGIMKGTDELDILEWRKTNATDSANDTKKLIEKFTSWKKEQDYHILSAGTDFVEIKFREPVINAERLAVDIAELCPEAIEQFSGSIPNLITVIKQMNGFYFWWDGESRN